MFVWVVRRPGHKLADKHDKGSNYNRISELVRALGGQTELSGIERQALDAERIKLDAAQDDPETRPEYASSECRLVVARRTRPICLDPAPAAAALARAKAR